jgi:D-hexose-6-phosphate mutarotase
MLVDMKDISDKIYWTKGYEAGVEAERDRIYKAVYNHFRLFDGALNRTHKISEVELITIIKTEAEDDSSIRAGHSSTSGI